MSITSFEREGRLPRRALTGRPGFGASRGRVKGADWRSAGAWIGVSYAAGDVRSESRSPSTRTSPHQISKSTPSHVTGARCSSAANRISDRLGKTHRRGIDAGSFAREESLAATSLPKVGQARSTSSDRRDSPRLATGGGICASRGCGAHDRIDSDFVSATASGPAAVTNRPESGGTSFVTNEV